jgi:protein TonB
MLISKFDLCRPEWLELVFNDRNKEYGAYDLRKHYSANLLKAMGIAFFSIALLFVGFGIFKPKPTEFVRIVQFDPAIKLMVAIPPKKVISPKPEITKPAPAVSTIKNPTYVVAPDLISVNPPVTTTLKTNVIGTETVKGPGTVDNGPVTDLNAGSGGTSLTSKIDNTPVDANILEVMPEPFGGAIAWSKFLQKNIHYPNQASEIGAQGKVWLSFIIERDGHLSNIVVERGVGHGLDEEALRVLKLAPAWKPGIQNGQPVRVKYTIPINFQISDPD